MKNAQQDFGLHSAEHSFKRILEWELSMPNRAALGQRQYGFSIWGNFCFEFFNGDIDFDRRDMFLHLFCSYVHQ